EPKPVPVVTQAADGGGSAGNGCSRDMQDTVDVQENRRHGSRVYSVGDRLPLLTVEWTRRSACAEELDACVGDLRRRGLDGAARTEEARTSRPGSAGTRRTDCIDPETCRNCPDAPSACHKAGTQLSRSRHGGCRRTWRRWTATESAHARRARRLAHAAARVR